MLGPILTVGCGCALVVAVLAPFDVARSLERFEDPATDERCHPLDHLTREKVEGTLFSCRRITDMTYRCRDRHGEVRIPVEYDAIFPAACDSAETEAVFAIVERYVFDSPLQPVVPTDVCVSLPDVDQHQLALLIHQRGAQLFKTEPARAEQYFACAISIGGPWMFGWIARDFMDSDEPRALSFHLAAAALGSSESKQSAGEILLRRATTRDDRQAALALLSSAMSDCRSDAFDSIVSYGLANNDPTALIEGAAWLNVQIVELFQVPRAVDHYARTLDKVNTRLTPQERLISEQRQRSILEERHFCVLSDSDKRTNQDWKKEYPSGLRP